MLRLGLSVRQAAEEWAKNYATNAEQAESLESFIQQMGRYLS